VELHNIEVEEMITSSSPSLLGAETEVLPKGHLGLFHSYAKHPDNRSSIPLLFFIYKGKH